MIHDWIAYAGFAILWGMRKRCVIQGLDNAGQ